MKVDIIGGGIIGLSSAYYLAKENISVTVFEKDKLYKKASFARSCGGLRCQFFTKENILMSRYSIDFIKNETSIAFNSNGYLMLFGEEQEEDFKYSTALQQELGATTKTLTPVELKAQYPWIFVDDIRNACYTSDGSEGWIDPYSLHNWFKDEAKKLGVKIDWMDGKLLTPKVHPYKEKYKCDKDYRITYSYDASIAVQIANKKLDNAGYAYTIAKGRKYFADSNFTYCEHKSDILHNNRMIAREVYLKAAKAYERDNRTEKDK